MVNYYTLLNFFFYIGVFLYVYIINGESLRKVIDVAGAALLFFMLVVLVAFGLPVLFSGEGVEFFKFFFFFTLKGLAITVVLPWIHDVVCMFLAEKGIMDKKYITKIIERWDKDEEEY